LRRLIINADDFGFTRDVNAGIVQVHRSGVLTSTTLMANGEAFDDAVRLAKETPTLDIGAHLVLVQGNSLLDGRPLPVGPRQLLPVLARRALNVYAELKAQIQKIVSAGLKISHLDSHKHTHLVPGVFRTVVKLADEFGIPWVRLPLDPSFRFANRYYRRFATGKNVRMTDHFLGFRLTGSLTEETFIAALEKLEGGTTEFMCHPGYLGEELKQARTRLKESRLRELEALTSPRVRKLIAERGIELTPF
jgi:chitin disaccharide deacetylase